MLPKKFRLPPENFEKVYHQGKKARGKYGMFVFVKTETGNPRFGFVVSRKIGGAVVRNRMVRLLRVVIMEIVNEKNLSGLSMDFQYIAFSYCDKKNLLRKEIEEQFNEILSK